MLIRKLEAEVLAERQCAAVMVAAGAEGVEWPSVASARVEFDAALVAETEAVESEQDELMRALGVR